MSRYNFTGTRIDKNTGNRVLKSTLYPEIRINDGDKFIYPLPGDRLESIAYRYYGDTTLWWIIRNGGFGLKPAVKIRIPNNVPQIINDLRIINNEI